MKWVILPQWVAKRINTEFISVLKLSNDKRPTEKCKSIESDLIVRANGEKDQALKDVFCLLRDYSEFEEENGAQQRLSTLEAKSC